MSRVKRGLVDPGDPQSVVDMVSEVIEVTERIEFGDPLDPNDPQSVALAGDTATSHPGTLVNVHGSYVEKSVTSLDTAITCYHNLALPVVAADEPNVRWTVHMWQHNGAQATYWDDLRFPTTATRMGGNDPGFALFLDDGAGSRGVFVSWFDAAAEEEVFFVAQMPHTWKEGTDITPHVHWVPSANGNAGEVVSWGLEYTWANIGATFGNTTIISTNTHTPADDPLVANRHYISFFSPISGTGKEFSSMLVCRVFRDAAGALLTDDYGSDAGLLETDFHHQRDSLGSATVNDKTDPGLTRAPISVVYDTADTVDENSIQLRFHAGFPRLVDNSNPLKVTLFFTPAVR